MALTNAKLSFEGKYFREGKRKLRCHKVIWVGRSDFEEKQLRAGMVYNFDEEGGTNQKVSWMGVSELLATAQDRG